MTDRQGFEAFDCAPALRLQAHERVSELQIKALNQKLDRLEALMERLEKRLWIALYGVVAAIMGQFFQSLLVAVP